MVGGRKTPPPPVLIGLRLLLSERDLIHIDVILLMEACIAALFCRDCRVYPSTKKFQIYEGVKWFMVLKILIIKPLGAGGNSTYYVTGTCHFARKIGTHNSVNSGGF